MHGFYSRAELDRIATQILGERLPGRPDQGIYEESAIQNFKIGARRRVEGGWTIHYCQVNEASGFHTMRLAGNGNVMDAANEFTALSVAALAGQPRITIVDAVSPLNYYENGLCECWHAGLVEQHRVKSSTATAGGVVVLTLYDNLITGLDATDSVSLSPSPYRNVQAMGVTHAQYVSAVGLPLFSMTDDYYAWIVTWGPVSVSMQGGHGPGEAVDMHDVYCHQDGTCADGTFFGISAGTESPQHVGYGLPAGAYGHSQIMLQLDP